MKKLRFTLQCRLCSLIILLSLGATTLVVAQEQLTPEKRYVRWRLIEVARKSLADSILTQLRQGVTFQKLARQHSLHASAKEGGEIGWAVLDSVDSDFKTVVASLPIGGPSAILQSGNYFFVLYKKNELPESGYLQWKEQKSEVDSLLNRIELLLNTGNSPAAMTLIKEAEERVTSIEDKGASLKLWDSKGKALIRLSQFRDSVILFDSMLKISRSNGDTYWESVALGNLGNVYRLSGRYQQAVAYLDSALVIAREIGDRAGKGRWLGGLGNAYGSLGQYQRAIAYLDSALIIAREVGDRQIEGGFLGNLGDTYRMLGQYWRAIAYFDSALSLTMLS